MIIVLSPSSYIFVFVFPSIRLPDKSRNCSGRRCVGRYSAWEWMACGGGSGGGGVMVMRVILVVMGAVCGADNNGGDEV